MTIQLNVVGVFYNRAINVASTTTVKSVMDQANNNRGANDPYLIYGDTNFGGKIILDRFAIYHYVPFKGRNPTPTYPAGWYTLKQGPGFSTNPYTVWQYYLFDANNQRVAIPSNKSFTLQTVQPGWKIVWRLVSILNAPTGYENRYQGPVPDDLRLGATS